MKRLSVFARGLLCTVFFALTGALHAQSVQAGKVDSAFLNDFVSKTWTTADGLPGMAVNAILQDKKGYIYIGTYDGLVRFDGVEFTVYSKSVDSRFGFQSVRSLFEDKDGNLWVGHNSEGVSCIKPTGEIIRYTSEDGLPNDSVRAISADKKGNIFIGTAAGLCYITEKGEIKELEGLSELGQSNILVSRLYCDTGGRIWITTASANNLFVYEDGVVKRFDGIRSVKDPSVNSVNQDSSGAFWFGVAPHFAVRIKGQDETLFDLTHDHQSGTVVNSIMQDNSGNYWFASDSGLTVLHNGFYTYYDKRNGIDDDYINDVMQDSEGNIWLTYNRAGLQKLSTGKFRTVSLASTVNAIADDERRGGAWIGADDGLYFYDGEKFQENDLTRLCKGMRVRHVSMTDSGELLIASYASNTYISVLPDGKTQIFTKESGLAGGKGRVALKSKSGDYFVGTTEGLSIIHSDGQITNLGKEDGFANDFIMTIYEDDDGRVWVGTDGGGVLVLSKDKRIEKHYNVKNGLSGNVIFKINEIKGDIWIATGTGLSKYNKSDDSFFNYDSTCGLGTDDVFQMVLDYTGTVWMTSNHGIISVDYNELLELSSGERKRLSAKLYGASDGLLTGGVTATSLSMKDSKGKVWLTLVDGFAIYDPVKSGKNTITPKIDIQEYSIDSERHVYHGEKIVLPPGTKRLNIKYTGLSFISSDSMRFSSMLSPFEENYGDFETSRQVSYTNLKHGTYEFTVRAENSDGVSGEPCAPLIIEKQPYIWELAWFWVLIGATVVLIASLIVAAKIRAMRRYQIELEQKVEERTRDLKIANEKAERLLLNILPAPIAAELTEHPERTIAKEYPNVTVLFTDIVGFTKMSGSMSAEEVVTMLNKMISMFDESAKEFGIEKIKTIGDAYMAAAGLTEERNNGGAEKMLKFARALMENVRMFNATSTIQIQIRLGINTGELVAGVIGKSKFIYDIWGDTVNVASRMESTGEPMKIHVSESTYEQTKSVVPYGESVEVAVKGKGNMKTYFI